MHLKKSISSYGLIFVLASCFATAPSAADTASVAMVTDLQGRAALRVDPRKPSLAILSEIKAGSRVQFNADSRAVVVYLQSGQEFEVKGPALVLFGRLQPEAISGNKPVKRGVALSKSGKDIRIKPVVVAQAVIVMRSVNPDSKLELLGPGGSKTLDARPLFQWKSVQGGLDYLFELLDDTGASIFSSRTKEPKVQLPDTVNLKDGIAYTWVVSTKLPDGKQFSNAGDFTVASEALKNEVQQLQPAANAPLSELVVFATWLEQMDLRDEARRYWKLAAAERQDDERLKVLAGE